MSMYDLVVIGGGPGGYVCAIRASQLGLRSALIEKRETIGGTCMNVGCIPTKALLESTERYYALIHGEMEAHGIHLEKPTLDFGTMIDRKERIVKELTDGLNFLMKKNRIDILHGTGRLKRAGNPIEIEIPELSRTVQTERCVIATGSAPRHLILNGGEIPFDGKTVIHSDHAVSPESCPKSLAIIGGGVIGLEMASIYSRAGAETTVIEFLPEILQPVDRQLRETAKRAYASQGIKILTGREVTGLTRDQSSVALSFKDRKGAIESVTADRLLVAIGRSPYTEGLGAKEIGVELDERGFIRVHPESLETTVPKIYAIGDVKAGPMLAHRAGEEGVMVAEIIAGKPGHVNYEAIPFIVYTSPEVAWVGRGEEQCKNEGIAVKTGKFLFRPNGRAKAMNLTDGMAKIIADATSDRILGVQIVGAHASELIQEAVIAIEFGASSEDIARSFHAHPTLAEILHEAALDVDGRAIHS